MADASGRLRLHPFHPNMSVGSRVRVRAVTLRLGPILGDGQSVDPTQKHKICLESLPQPQFSTYLISVWHSADGNIGRKVAQVFRVCSYAHLYSNEERASEQQIGIRGRVEGMVNG